MNESQLGIDGIEAAPVVERARLCNLALQERLRLFARYLVQGFDDAGLPVDSNTAAALAAGIGSNRESARALAARYIRSPVVIAEMGLHRTRLEGEADANRAEVVGYWRQLVQENTAQRKIKVPVMDDAGKVTGFKEVYRYDAVLAEKVVEKMARATGVLKDGKTIDAQPGDTVIIAGKADLSAEEWGEKYGAGG